MQDIPNLQRLDAETGKVALRNAVVAAWFVHRPVHEIGAAVAAMLDDYRSYIPTQALRWVVPNASAEQWKPVADRTLPGIQRLLDGAGMQARDMTSFRIADLSGGAAAFEFRFAGKPKRRPMPPAGSLVQVTLPIETAHAAYADGLVERVVQLGSRLDFSYGYCAPALRFRELGLVRHYDDLRGLAVRHPGYDVENNLLAAWELGLRVRGARWLTLLGPELQAALGGAEALASGLASPIEVLPIGRALMIRAGAVPELGDVNRRIDTPLLRQVAGVLEPVTAFDERHLVFSRFEEDDLLLQRWERRFL